MKLYLLDTYDDRFSPSSMSNDIRVTIIESVICFIRLRFFRIFFLLKNQALFDTFGLLEAPDIISVFFKAFLRMSSISESTVEAWIRKSSSFRKQSAEVSSRIPRSAALRNVASTA